MCMCAFTTSLEPAGSEVLMCVRGELEEYVEEIFLHLESAGLKQTSTCFSHVCAVMRDFHHGGEAFDNAGDKLEVTLLWFQLLR